MALEKATITNLDTNAVIRVRFNPEEYSLDSGNSFAEIGVPGLQAAPMQYVRGNNRTLTMELFFDSYELEPELRDVRLQTNQIVALLDKDSVTQAPPILLFSWGSLNFNCVLESVKQKFTMFVEDGSPVRATLGVTFKEFEPISIDIERGFFVGPPTVHNIVSGDTVSAVSAEVLGDPTAWREIAELNDVEDPLELPVGAALLIPGAKGR
jgi:nucleoid-associated protein YgaU